jgi:hypothetical protein
MEVYSGVFSCWQDVLERFVVSEDPRPDQVYFACYDEDLYEGYSSVLYRVGDRYYYVSASHCSCYDLEGQWDPEEYSREELVHALQRGDWFYFHEDSVGIREEMLRRVSS